MVTQDLTAKRVLLHLLKDFSSTHTITSLAKELGLSRVGIWKVLKKLDENKHILVKTVGAGKTSISIITLNLENPLVEKMLSLYLAEEALKQRRWQVNFAELDRITDFLILYGSVLHSPKEANDIDILGIAQKKNFVKIQGVLDKAQKTQSKKIHSINFTRDEFKSEFKKQNKAFIDAVKKGVILFGQDKFVKFIGGMAK
ncbi:MAG TPA: HTH domain-containing protein [Candidatus Nanoarchaeia archaeon]|nr:HTH domain-containing protein [Candidatus Nanoarchaeia archaeon]